MTPMIASETTALRPDRRQSAMAPFLTYVLVFHLAWACWPYFGYPRVVAVGDRTLEYAILNISIRLIVWVLPVWVYLRFVDGVEPFEYLKLRQHVGRGLVIAIVLTTLNLLGSMLRL